MDHVIVWSKGDLTCDLIYNLLTYRSEWKHSAEVG